MTPAEQDHRRKPRARDTWRKDDVRKAVEGAIAGGMPVGRIEFRRDGFCLIALDDSRAASEAEHCAQLIREAFEDGDGD